MPKAFPKFRLRLAAVKTGDFGPCGLAVYDASGECVVIHDGAVVETLADARSSWEDDVELSYRKVCTSDGFEGDVLWWDFDGRSGFEEV